MLLTFSAERVVGFNVIRDLCLAFEHELKTTGIRSVGANTGSEFRNHLHQGR